VSGSGNDIKSDVVATPRFLKNFYVCVTVIEIILHEYLALTSEWPPIHPESRREGGNGYAGL